MDMLLIGMGVLSVASLLFVSFLKLALGGNRR